MKCELCALQMQGVKLEAFIFDTFVISKHPTLMEVRRDEEFAPVKNAPGSAKDSPDTAKAAVLALHKRYARPCRHDVGQSHTACPMETPCT